MATRNCLVGYGLVVKVSDFGLSRNKVVYTMSDKNKPIPWKWSAPEVLLNGKRGISNKVVVYLIYIIVLGHNYGECWNLKTYLIIDNKCYQIESKYVHSVFILKSQICVIEYIREKNEITSTLTTLSL